jgi:nitrite reductase/ring-hydroxylating ferredoxin subunit
MASWIGSALPSIRRDGMDYLLVSQDERLYLVANSCPHRGAHLKFGHLNACDELVCPLHQGTFPLGDLIARASTIRLDELKSPAA